MVPRALFGPTRGVCCTIWAHAVLVALLCVLCWAALPGLRWAGLGWASLFLEALPPCLHKRLVPMPTKPPAQPPACTRAHTASAAACQAGCCMPPAPTPEPLHCQVPAYLRSSPHYLLLRCIQRVSCLPTCQYACLCVCVCEKCVERQLRGDAIAKGSTVSQRDRQARWMRTALGPWTGSSRREDSGTCAQCRSPCRRCRRGPPSTPSSWAPPGLWTAV